MSTLRRNSQSAPSFQQSRTPRLHAVLAAGRAEQATRSVASTGVCFKMKTLLSGNAKDTTLLSGEGGKSFTVTWQTNHKRTHFEVDGILRKSDLEMVLMSIGEDKVMSCGHQLEGRDSGGRIFYDDEPDDITELKQYFENNIYTILGAYELSTKEKAHLPELLKNRSLYSFKTNEFESLYLSSLADYAFAVNTTDGQDGLKFELVANTKHGIQKSRELSAATRAENATRKTSEEEYQWDVMPDPRTEMAAVTDGSHSEDDEPRWCDL